MAFNGSIYPSLALATVRIATKSRQVALSPLSNERSKLMLDGQPVPLDERATMLIRFRGGRGAFPHVSAADVLNGRTPADLMKDRIVFVGATALGTGDVVATPFDTAMPGIEVHAAAAETLLQRDFIVTPPYGRAYELLGSAVLGMTAATLVAVAGYFAGSVLSVLLLGILWWATAGVAAAGVFLSPLFPTMSVVSTLAALTFAKVRHERRRAEWEQGRRERAQQFTVHSLTSLVESRDGATGRHARRTQQYARLLATRLAELPRFCGALTPEHVDLIARLAPLHDIGKVGVRDAVLLKEGPLSAEELDEMRRHPGFGHDTILNAERLAGLIGHADEELLRVAKDIVYTHHERWDGKGYPRGLSGEDIPIGGRIVALVDVYDALIDSRSYHRGVTHEEAVAVIRAGRATHFDPEVVDAFLTIEADFRRLTGERGDPAVAET
jgi:adenylate cyclase